MTTPVKKRQRPDVTAFGKMITEKYPTVLAHLAEMERQEKIGTRGPESMTNDDADQTRPNFTEIAAQVTERYPNVLTVLAEKEIQEACDAKVQTWQIDNTGQPSG